MPFLGNFEDVKPSIALAREDPASLITVACATNMDFSALYLARTHGIIHRAKDIP